MDWDIPLWLGVVLACADGCIALAVGLRYGPRRARALIVADPLFVKTEERLQETEVSLESLKNELHGLVETTSNPPQLDVKTPIGEALTPIMDQVTALQVAIDGSLATVSKDIRSSTDEAVKGLPRSISEMELRVQAKLDVLGVKATNVTIPESEIGRVTTSIKSTLRRGLETPELLEGMSKLLDEKLKALPRGDDLEQLLTDAELNTTEGKQDSYDWLLEKGLPEDYAFRVADKGPTVLRKVAKMKGWNILEILDGGDG